MSITESPDRVATTAGEAPLLSVQNIEVVYNEISLAVRGISLSIPRGAAVALLGANGAGKTTTIRALSGLLGLHDGRVRDGSITFDGQSLIGMSPSKIVSRGIAQVPEGRKVFGHLTVEENLKAGGAAIGYRDWKETLAQVYDLFPKLADRRNGTAGWMSGGEQQMVAVGRALMAKPRLLLLDEVSLGLAPQVLETIIDRLATFREQQGTAMLMVEQNARVALEFSDYGYIMENGRIVLDGPCEQLRRNEDVQEFYLGITDAHEKKSYAAVKHYKRRKRWAA